MFEEIKNIKIKKSDVRSFGVILSIILLLISGFLFWKEQDLFQIVLAIGVTLFLIAMAIPAALKQVYWIWMIFGIILGWIMTRVILSFLFYLVFTPIGLTLQLLGKKFLELKWDKSKESYWSFRTNENLQNNKYEKQF